MSLSIAIGTVAAILVGGHFGESHLEENLPELVPDLVHCGGISQSSPELSRPTHSHMDVKHHLELGRLSP